MKHTNRITFIMLVLGVVILSINALSISIEKVCEIKNTESNPELSIGAVIPNASLKMQDVSGESFSLNDLKQKKGLVVIFSSNVCPFVQATRK